MSGCDKVEIFKFPIADEWKGGRRTECRRDRVGGRKDVRKLCRLPGCELRRRLFSDGLDGAVIVRAALLLFGSAQCIEEDAPLLNRPALRHGNQEQCVMKQVPRVARARKEDAGFGDQIGRLQESEETAKLVVGRSTRRRIQLFELPG